MAAAVDDVPGHEERVTLLGSISTAPAEREEGGA